MSTELRVLVTGTRNTGRWLWDVDEALRKMWIGRNRPVVTIVHGACPSGVDMVAGIVGRRQGFIVEPHPADWETHGKAAGPDPKPRDG